MRGCVFVGVCWGLFQIEIDPSMWKISSKRNMEKEEEARGRKKMNEKEKRKREEILKKEKEKKRKREKEKREKEKVKEKESERGDDEPNKRVNTNKMKGPILDTGPYYRLHQI